MSRDRGRGTWRGESGRECRRERNVERGEWREVPEEADAEARCCCGDQMLGVNLS